MHPSVWHPPVELSCGEQTIITRIKRAKLFVFLRHQRHELFDDAFQEELATLYAPSLRGRAPEQRLYEGIRPVVLYGLTPAERAQETGLAERSLGRAADAFDTYGMISLFRPTKAQREDQAILSSDIFQSQDLACVLIVLDAAVEQFGAPSKLITDNGGVFLAKQLLAICEALEIEKEYIHTRQTRYSYS